MSKNKIIYSKLNAKACFFIVLCFLTTSLFSKHHNAQQWQALINLAIQKKNDYSQIYNNRAASDEYEGLGIINAQELYQDGVAEGIHFVTTQLKTTITGDVLNFLQKYVGNTVGITIPGTTARSLKTFCVQVINELNTTKNPLTVTTAQATQFVHNYGILVGVANTLSYSAQEMYNPYKLYALEIINNLVTL